MTGDYRVFTSLSPPPPGSVWTENIWRVFRVKPPYSNFSGVVRTENIWRVFHSENAIFKFFQRSVDETVILCSLRWKHQFSKLLPYIVVRILQYIVTVSLITFQDYWSKLPKQRLKERRFHFFPLLAW